MGQLSFCGCVNPFNLVTSKSIHIPGNNKISLFCGCIIFHCVYIPQFLYPLIHGWASSSIPCLNPCETDANIGVQVSPRYSDFTPFGYAPVMGPLDHRIVLCLFSKRISNLFSSVGGSGACGFGTNVCKHWWARALGFGIYIPEAMESRWPFPQGPEGRCRWFCTGRRSSLVPLI